MRIHAAARLPAQMTIAPRIHHHIKSTLIECDVDIRVPVYVRVDVDGQRALSQPGSQPAAHKPITEKSPEESLDH